ncbi:hypothetical protein VNO77_48707 [Canavalia gladiata]|uniref:Uncharacterized protein n=1 Tax=Canavalia gladiata TaxID=3824 RepID=A0AAN9JDU6_CANGL
MREARRSTFFKYTTWVLAMQCGWTLMSIRMNHPFHGGKSLPARKEDSKLQIVSWNLSIFRGLEGVWKHIRTLELKWKNRCNSSYFGNGLVSSISRWRQGKGYNSVVECHLDVVEVISSSLIIPKPNWGGGLYFWERTPDEYEAHGYKLCLGMKENSESALSTNKEAISNATRNLMESSILAQDERWRHA